MSDSNRPSAVAAGQLAQDSNSSDQRTGSTSNSSTSTSMTNTRGAPVPASPPAFLNRRPTNPEAAAAYAAARSKLSANNNPSAASPSLSSTTSAWPSLQGFSFPIDVERKPLSRVPQPAEGRIIPNVSFLRAEPKKAKQVEEELDCFVSGDTTEIFVPLLTWLGADEHTNADGEAFALVVTYIFAVYAKAGGMEDAAFVVDGRPPVALLTPFARGMDTPFAEIVSEISTKLAATTASSTSTTTSSSPSNVSADRKKVIGELDASNDQEQNGSPLIGNTAVMLKSTAKEMGISALMQAFDILWIVDPNASSESTGGEIVTTVSLWYNHSIFSDISASNWLQLLRNLVAVEDIYNKTLNSIDVLDAEMKFRLLTEWQPSEFAEEDYTTTSCDLFARAMRQYVPDPAKAIAIYEPKSKREVTYKEFDELAWKFAWFLHSGPCREQRSRFGVDATVALHLPRCADWYILMLGTHRAGAAYLSLDPDFPADRLNYIVSDSGAMVLCTLTSMKGTLDYNGPTLCIDTLWDEVRKLEVPSDFRCPAGPHSPAYMIYTSGSTGKPKGVLIEHINLCSFVLSERELFKLNNKQRIIQGFSTSFDASVEEIWLAFASGSSLISVEKQTMQDVDALSDLIIEYKATVLSTVPTLVATMEADRMKQLEMIIVGGEACNQEVIDAWAPGRIFVNSYGPTEATVACTAEFCEAGKRVTIGRAQPNYTAYILDENKNLLPPGVPGELIMGGPGVTRGYVNRPELTAEKFLPCPFHDRFTRMYCTGDLVRWNNEGKLEYLGRIDSQVKLRGFRIEVSEIENNLSTFPGVITAVVVLRNETGVPYLCAYMICEQRLKDSFSENAFRAHLKSSLPTYMIPSRFCVVEEIPRSPAGKTDRKAFPPPPPPKKEEDASGEKKAFARPATETETAVLALWIKHLPNTGEPVSCTDNFFEIGGQSLLAGKVSSALRKAGFEQCSIKYLYNNPTVQKLAAALDQTSSFSRQEPAQTQLPVRHIPGACYRTFFFIAQMLGVHLVMWCMSAYVFAFLTLYNQGELREYYVGQVVNISMVDPPVFPDLVVRYSLEGLLLAALGTLIVILYMFTFIPLFKWLVIGTIEEGTHSVHSWFFLRWWLVRGVVGMLPLWYLQGTWWINVYLRILGARVGRGVHWMAPSVPDADLLEIGEDSWIGNESSVLTSEIIDHMLILRKVKIGRASAIGARCAVRGGAVVGDGAIVRHLSLLQENTVVPDFEEWGGSPAVKAGNAPTFADVSAKVIATERRNEKASCCCKSCGCDDEDSSSSSSSSSPKQPRVGARPKSSVDARPLLAEHNNNNNSSVQARDGPARASEMYGSVADLLMGNDSNNNNNMIAQIAHNGEKDHRLRACRPSTGMEVFLASWFLFYYIVMSSIILMPLMGIFVAIWGLVQTYSTDPRLGLLIPFFPAMIAAYFLYIHIFVVIARWIVLPWNVQPGFYPCTSSMFHRKLMFDMLTRFSLVIAHPMYASIFIQYWLRAMGVDVGKSVEVSNLFGFTPGLTKLGDETFIADFIGVNPPEMFRGVLKLDYVEVERRAFVGNGSVLPPGSKLKARSLLGLMSYPSTEVPADSTHIGSPSFEIPRMAANKEGDEEKEAATFRPTCGLVVCRTIWEFFRSVMPAACLSNSIFVAFLTCMQIVPNIFAAGELKKVFSLFIVISVVCNMLQLLLIKWIIVGKEHPTQYPLWSAGVWRGEFVVDSLVVLGGGGFMNFLRGTPLLPWIFRLLGATVGSNVYLDTILFTEPDMVTIGDNCCIGDRVTIQTHLFEDRVMKIDSLRIDDRVSIGPLCVVLYNTHIEKGCSVAPLSLVMKGENLGKGTHWAGIPAQRRAVPGVMSLPPLSVLPDRDLGGKVGVRNLSELSKSSKIRTATQSIKQSMRAGGAGPSGKSKLAGGGGKKEKTKTPGGRIKASPAEMLQLKTWLNRVQQAEVDDLTTDGTAPSAISASSGNLPVPGMPRPRGSSMQSMHSLQGGD